MILLNIFRFMLLLTFSTAAFAVYNGPSNSTANPFMSAIANLTLAMTQESLQAKTKARPELNLNQLLLSNKFQALELPDAIKASLKKPEKITLVYNPNTRKLRVEFKNMNNLCLQNVDTTYGHTLRLDMKFTKNNAYLEIPMQAEFLKLRSVGRISTDGVELHFQSPLVPINLDPVIQRYAFYTVTPRYASVLPDNALARSLNFLDLSFAHSKTTVVSCQ